MNGLPGLHEKIAALVPQVPGWCSIEKASTLAGLIVGLRPAVTVEVGIFGGASFLPMAMAHKHNQHGTIYGIEPWSNEIAIAAQTEDESREWWAKVDLKGIRENFYARLRELQLEDWVRIVERPSSQANVPPGIGLLHIDGAHNDLAVQDVVRFAQHVEVGGICYMDDIAWVGGGVTRAVHRLLQMGFREMYKMDTGAAFIRIR